MLQKHMDNFLTAGLLASSKTPMLIRLTPYFRRHVVKGTKDVAFDFGSQIYVAEFSPYEWSQDLICVGTENTVVIGAFVFPEDFLLNDDEGKQSQLQMYQHLSSSGQQHQESNEIYFVELKTFHQNHRPQSIAWSPHTTLRGLPRVVHFAVAFSVYTEENVNISSNNVIKVYKTDLSSKTTITEYEGHQSYINSINFDHEGSMLASVSDDLTCRVWNVKDRDERRKLEFKINLSSPGMAVCWHSTEPGKLLVAEKSGLLQIFNIATQQPIISLDSGTTPLMSAHWAPSNSLYISALAGGEMIVWDISRPSRPVEVRPVHPQGGRCIKFSSSSEIVVATHGRPGHQLKVYNIRTKLPKISVPLPIAYGLSWHQTLPYIAVGCDHRLNLWKV